MVRDIAILIPEENKSLPLREKMTSGCIHGKADSGPIAPLLRCQLCAGRAVTIERI
jgi:hypothetical protein